MSNIIKIDFQGAAISFDERGWFNATVAAKRFGKRPVDWLHLPDTAKYLVALAERNGKSGILEQFKEISGLDFSRAASQAKLLRLAKSTRLVATKSGSPLVGGGTWLHPKLAVRFAQWLDMDFAVWCDEQIDNIIRNGLARPPSVYEQIIALQVADKTTAAKASLGGRWMNERKEALRHLRPELAKLESELQPALPLSA